MKDSEFIELLNLYLDHEISPADAARLEAEVQSNPARRHIYQQYCRMQKACTLLAKDFASAPAASPDEARKVVSFEPRRPAWGPGLFAVGGLVAAAACVAVIFVNRPGDAAGVSHASSALAAVAPVETRVVVAPAENVSAQSMKTRTVTMPTSRRAELQPVLVAGSLSLGNQWATPTSAVATEPVPQLDWIRGLQIAPMQRVQVEELRFNARPAEVPQATIYSTRPRPAQHGVVEMTAFQFNK
jgi:anti-sigma factor RsiW